MHENYKKFQCQSCTFGFWKIMGGRQIDVTEADTLLKERRLGPLDGFRSRLGKPFSASLRLNDAHEVGFDFGDGSGDDSAEAPDFTGQEPLGACPKCKSRVFESGQAYVCEKAVGPEKTCDFRSGRVILQRPIERAQMQKLLASGKTDLLQFVSARTKRGFAAFLVRQPDGKIGFEFEARDPAKAGARRARGAASALRVLGPHPRDKKPVELHSGRYGPYVKHGDVNATLPDRDKVDSLTLAEAVTLLAEKAAKQGTGAPTQSQAQDPGEDRVRAAGRLCRRRRRSASLRRRDLPPPNLPRLRPSSGHRHPRARRPRSPSRKRSLPRRPVAFRPSSKVAVRDLRILGGVRQTRRPGASRGTR